MCFFQNQILKIVGLEPPVPPLATTVVIALSKNFVSIKNTKYYKLFLTEKALTF